MKKHHILIRTIIENKQGKIDWKWIHREEGYVWNFKYGGLGKLC